jgi:CBS domain-containing protein
MKTVRELLKHKGVEVHTIDPDVSVYEALQRMAQHDVGALVVLDERGEVSGLISERDYARKVILKGHASRDLKVREIMSGNPLCITSRHTVGECMELMTQRRFRHLPVVENGQIAGLISIGDVVRAIIEDQQSTIEEMESYIRNGR